VILAVISAAEHLRALQDRLGEDPAIAVFADTDSIKALETIAATCPRFVALNTTFAATGRGAALVAQLRSDSQLSTIHVRLLMEDENRVPLVIADRTAPAQKALLDTSRPLDRAGTRAAVRYTMDRRTIVVNGERSALIDLSVTGAQVLLPARVRPNEPVRLVLSHEAGEARFPGTVVWSIAVPTAGAIQYRAGVKLSNPDMKWIENYCHQAGGRPDLTFGAS